MRGNVNQRAPWYVVMHASLDTDAFHADAIADLEVYPTLDGQMDSHQERGYGLIRRIAGSSEDPDARRMALAALIEFERAEETETLLETRVYAGEGNVRAARQSNGNVIFIAEREHTALVRRTH